MIRSFMPLDVVDLVFARKALSNKAKTKDGVGRKDATLSNLANIIGDWFNPQLRSSVWVYTEGFTIRGLVSVRDRHGPRSWEIDRLQVGEQDRNSCLRLLEYLSVVGGELEVDRIFLRLPADSPLLRVAQETGFLQYSTEHLYWRGSSDSHAPGTEAAPASAARRKRVDDEYRLFELYLRCIPAYVRRVEGMTFKEWQSNRNRSVGQEWVFEKDGSLVGWAALNSTRSLGQLDMIVAARDEMENMVNYGLTHLSGCSQMYCLAPDFEVTLLRLLEDRGFSRISTYSALAKDLVVRVVEPYAMPAVPA